MSFPADKIDSLAVSVLGKLEEREHRLLVWGYIEGAFSRDEVESAAQDVIDASNEWESPQEVIDRLLQRALLFEFMAGGETVYRTRFAEAVRLFARLRQMFDPGQWATGPCLVADYRVAIRPRRYPDRNQTPAMALAKVKEMASLAALEEQVVCALLGAGNDREMPLARFQVETAAHLFATRADKTRASMVCAGTGTGKTLAFYLPGLAMVAQNLRKKEHWTQVIAVYPRNELLKDQFTECYIQARKLDSLVVAQRGRKIRIGAYFGPTPTDTSLMKLPKHQRKYPTWEQTDLGFICPFLRCPNCGGELVWRTADVMSNRSRLVCPAPDCGATVEDDEVLLTRQQMHEEPPDILFTTTEMLNRHMSSAQPRKLFGIGQPAARSPYLMLLDEVHTYCGPHGAHVALLLRRWRHAVKRPVHFVGLSATLNDPQGFVAQLTGIHVGEVYAVLAEDDMKEEGREYHLVLRGDPASGASLLSTSIQALMLLARILDPAGQPTSGGLFGQKVFAFNNALDVTNRLYHYFLSAEARSSKGQPLRNSEPLAALRGDQFPDGNARLREGQRWSLCTAIGHKLSSPCAALRVGRVSSQDAGVDAGADVIVATSSLEVGFNDPAVGAVLQHKAPYSAASFLQRKGRAGRRRITRPWTVVVLSDYGRDRLAYQAYDQLLDPVLERPALPTDNRYVLRIQAVYSFIEWMAGQLPPHIPCAQMWQDFAYPWKYGVPLARQDAEAKIIRRVLCDKDYRDQLAQHLMKALQISKEEVAAIYWEPPRALMTAVLPTLLRRLETRWRRLPRTGEKQPPAGDLQKDNLPLPEFVPDNLFSDLSLPEVTILADRRPGRPPAEHRLALVQMLSLLAPGRVTRHFGIEDIEDAHWVPLPNTTDPLQDLVLEEYCAAFDEVGTFRGEVGGAVRDVRCVRPYLLAARQCPKNVRQTSNAFLVWRSQFCPPAQGEKAELPAASLFEEIACGVEFFTHNANAPLRVRRFAIQSEADLQLANGQQKHIRVRFFENGGEKRAAVGFEHEVDAIRFQCRLPEWFRKRAAQGEALRACRTDYFRYCVATDPDLVERANHFRLDSLAQVYLSTLLSYALAHELSLPKAVEVFRLDWEEQVRQALDVIFQVMAVESDDEEQPGAPEPEDEDEDEERAQAGGRVREALRQLFADEEVRERLLSLSAVLWDASDAEWQEWFRRRLKATLGGALLQACYQMARQSQMSDLLLDLDSGAPDPDAPKFPDDMEEIWISEGVIGGAGVVEEIRQRYLADPRQFLLLAEMALAPSDFEVVDRELTRLVELSVTSPDVQHAFAEVRQASTNADLHQAHLALVEVMRAKHLHVSHPVLTALNARVLRRGSTSTLDELLRLLLLRWYEAQQHLEVEIDGRVFCYVAATDPEVSDLLGQVLQQAGAPAAQSLGERYSLLYSLLWPRGSLVRERALETYNPFSWPPRMDPLLLLQALEAHTRTVDVTAPNWRPIAEDALRLQGVVRLRAPYEKLALLQEAICSLLVQPVEVDYLRLYPHVARTEMHAGGVSATLHLREAIQ